VEADKAAGAVRRISDWSEGTRPPVPGVHRNRP